MTGQSRVIGGLTKKERIFVKEYIKSGNAKRAAGLAYPNLKPKNTDKYGSVVLRRPEVKQGILKAIEKAGLTDDYLAETLKKNMEPGIGKGANAATVNKTIEMLLRLKEKMEHSGAEGIKLTVLQGIVALSNQEILDKRSKLATYFSRIIGNRDQTPIEDAVIEPQQAK